MRLKLAAILVAIAGGVFWIEEGHRVVIDAPVADAAPAAAAACPDNDNVPYSTACLEYLNASPDMGPRLQVVSIAAPAPCPDNDRAPYSPSCIAFMMGATEIGMTWRATERPAFIPAPQ